MVCVLFCQGIRLSWFSWTGAGNKQKVGPRHAEPLGGEKPRPWAEAFSRYSLTGSAELGILISPD
jgi:hypothetical protein